jgi:endo-1,4-beta-xylanase
MLARRRCLHPYTALLTLVPLVACSTPSEEAAVLGSTGQALKAEHRGGDDHGHKKGHEKHGRHHGHHHHGHGHHDCDDDAEPTPPPDPVVFTPASAAARSGRLAGVAVASGPLASDPIYGQIIAAEFSDAVPENETKWGPLQPVDPQHWNFEPADAIVAFAESNDLRIKGHTLIWHNQLPPFITAETTPRRLRQYAERHIHKAVNHFRRDMFAWDVVNEAIADDGSGLRQTVFSDAFGERYIDRAFRLARAADHDAELYYNDFNTESINAKSDAVYALMTRLLDRRVPVDGVGFQGHFDARFAPSFDQMVENFQRFGDLGLSVNISELDVRIARLGGSMAYRLAVQKQIYQRVSAACLATEACDGVTTWGFTDRYSWVDSTFGADDPLLLDDNYQRKPAYYGYVDGFLGVPLDDPSLEPNLIGNSSLETGFDDWSVFGTGVLATAVDAAHTGLRSAIVSGRTASWNGPRHDITALTEGGRSYDISVFTRIAGAPSANTGLTAQVTCGSDPSQFLPIDNTTATDTGWVELAGVLTLPDCDLSSVAIYVEGPDAGVSILVDDLALREQPLANLITNSTFETGTAGWFGFGPSVIGTTTDAHSGDQAAVASGRTATWNGIATNLTSVVTSTATYRASAYVKVQNAATAPVNLTAAVRCAGGPQQFLPVASGSASNSAWTELSGSVQMPNCSISEFILYAEGPAAGVDILLDDVTFWQQSAGLGPNVLLNPGFETGTGSWFGFGAVTISATTARAHSGTQSGLVTGRTATWNGLATSLVGRVTPGRSYQVNAFAQVSTVSSPVNLTLQAQCEGGTQTFSTIAAATANNATWTEMNGTLAVPNCNLTTANFYIENAPAGVDIYLDDVSVREIP